MALKQLKEYFRKVEIQYDRLLHKTREFDEALKEGYFNQEQYDQALAMVSKAEENYKRLAYVMYLLNLPAREKKCKKYLKNTKDLRDKLSDSNEETIIKEYEDCFKNLDRLMEEKRKLTNDK